MLNKIKRFFNYKNLSALAFINFSFAFFLDSIVVFKHFKITSTESLIYLFTANFCFVLFTVLAVKKRKELPIKNFDLKKAAKKYYPLAILIAVVTVLAVMNYDCVAIYDAHLYYGSFVKALELYKMTLKTAIGAFILWGHVFIGSALYVAPFECMMYGEMTGTYIANTVLFCVTLIILYKLLDGFLVKSNKWFITFLVAAFAFMPYSFSLITYFNPDFYLEIYLIWLMYAYSKKNNLMVSFIGFLFCFTKDTGAFIYGFFALSMFLIESTYRYKRERFKWWKLSNIPYGKFVLWLIPAVLYGITFFIKGDLVLQHFEAAGSLKFGINSYDIITQGLQTFVYGFRWLILAVAAVALIVYIERRHNCRKNNLEYTPVTDESLRPQFLSNVVTIMLLNILLSVFTLSHCPRYTNPMNVMYVFILGISISIISDKNTIKRIISGVVSVLMLVQTYITVDPAIINGCSAVDTGSHLIYNIGNRKGQYAGFFEDLVGDYYVYNMEYSVYSDLVEQTIKHFNPQEDCAFHVYGLYVYEMHFAGLQYRIYWDKEKQSRTYVKNKNTITVYDATDSPDTEIQNEEKYDILLVVPGRKDAAQAINRYIDGGYEVTEAFTASNTYGNMTTYHFTYVG